MSLDGIQLASTVDAPDAALLERETTERFREAVAQLPRREGEVFCLRYFEDLSYQQIAETLSITAGAAAAALHKARAKLEAVLVEPVERE